MAEEDLGAFWEKAGFHVDDIDGHGEDDGGVTSLADLLAQLQDAASPVTRTSTSNAAALWCLG
jgi:hypothetical protein